MFNTHTSMITSSVDNVELVVKNTLVEIRIDGLKLMHVTLEYLKNVNIYTK